MRRLAPFGAALIVLLASAVSVSAYGGPQTSAAACGGKLVINVTHKVVNDADSGFGGAWAFDAYNRSIQVREVAPGMYCATVDYQGRFLTVAGVSPSGDSTVAAGINGTMNGGYRSTVFSGTLNPSPAYATKGNIGTFDYACDLAFNCNYFSWVGTYFSSTSGFDLAWWGWTYKAGQHGTWVNAIDQSSGDIN